MEIQIAFHLFLNMHLNNLHSNNVTRLFLSELNFSCVESQTFTGEIAILKLRKSWTHEAIKVAASLTSLTNIILIHFSTMEHRLPRCKGSLAYVHLACLERWLNQSCRSYCELCRYHFNVIETPRYRWWVLQFKNYVASYNTHQLIVAFVFQFFPHSFAPLK